MYQYRIDSDQRLNLLSFRGTLGHQDLLDCIVECAADPRFKAEYDGVLDLRSAEVEITPQETAELGKALEAASHPSTKWVLLVDMPRGRVLSEIYQRSTAPDRKVAAFSTIEAASEFLGRNIKGSLES
jgi:hypothetical protein